MCTFIDQGKKVSKIHYEDLNSSELIDPLIASMSKLTLFNAHFAKWLFLIKVAHPSLCHLHMCAPAASASDTVPGPEFLKRNILINQEPHQGHRWSQSHYRLCCAALWACVRSPRIVCSSWPWQRKAGVGGGVNRQTLVLLELPSCATLCVPADKLSET